MEQFKSSNTMELLHCFKCYCHQFRRKASLLFLRDLYNVIILKNWDFLCKDWLKRRRKTFILDIHSKRYWFSTLTHNEHLKLILKAKRVAHSASNLFSTVFLFFRNNVILESKLLQTVKNPNSNWSVDFSSSSKKTFCIRPY